MKIRGFNKTLNKWVYVEMEEGKVFDRLAEWYDIDPARGLFMNAARYYFHYFFGKHKWRYTAKSYSGNETSGHKEDSYIFECAICHKQKIVKVVD